MHALKMHIIPRYIYVLQQPNIHKNVLKRSDRKIRWAVRHILHLPSHCHNSGIHAALKSGGLGVLSFLQSIPRILLNRTIKLRGSDRYIDAAMQEAQNNGRLERLIERNCNTKLDTLKHNERELQLSFSGNGLAQTKNHPACSKILRQPPRYWNGEQYIRAVQLRLNLLPVRSNPTTPSHLRQCRNGCPQKETLCHILQHCSLVHDSRIKRPDHVVRRTAKEADRKGWNVQIEPRIRGSDGELLKPDLLIWNDSKLIVCDIGIAWEGPDPLSQSFATKVAKYSRPSFLESVSLRSEGRRIYVLPLIVGARGTWCSLNRHLMHHVGMSSKYIEDIIATTMRGGWQTHSAFMRAIWRRTRRIQPL